MYQLQASLGWLELKEEVKTFGATHNYTRLIPDLSGASHPPPCLPACLTPYRRRAAAAAALQRYQFAAAGGWRRMAETVHKQFSPEHPFTRLVPDLSGPPTLPTLPTPTCPPRDCLPACLGCPAGLLWLHT